MRAIALTAILSLVAALPTRADTLIVVGVIVKKDGSRVGGAPVRLVLTNSTGTPLATDFSSDRGVFALIRQNVSGDLNDLFVVYDGADGVAVPLKAAVHVADIVRHGRTGDLIVLPNLQSASNAAPAEIAERLDAIAATEAVLVAARIKDEQAGRLAASRHSLEILQAGRLTNAELASVRHLMGREVILQEGLGGRILAGVSASITATAPSAASTAPQ